MTKYVLLFGLLMAVYPLLAQAQEKPENDFDLMRRAILLSSMVDVYNIYCGGEADLATSFLEKFKAKDISYEQKETLTQLQIDAIIKTSKVLKEKDESCDKVDFMLKRLDLMRKLKDVSYLLNGIDPKTLSDGIIPDEYNTAEPE